MIKYPQYWNLIGLKYNKAIFIETLKSVLADIPCENLSYSGGLDSSLLLYFMLELRKEVKTFTVACHEDHPDIKYSMLCINQLKNKFHKQIDSDWIILKNTGIGDDLVSAFYKNLYTTKGVRSIIAGDGIDEFMCGYYKHQGNNKEKVYYNLMWKLQKEQLLPLDKNSHEVEIYLPYLDNRMLSLYAGIPLTAQIDSRNRKKILLSLAKGKLPKEIIERRKYGFCTGI